MTTIGTLIVGAVLSLGTLFGVNSLLGNTANVGGGTGTINQLQQFVATTSPVSAITQAVFGKSFRLSGQSTGCAQFDSNGVLTSSGVACGSGGGIGWASTTIPNSNSIYSTAVSNVGIGTTTPDTLLSLQSSTGPTITLARSAISLLAGDLLGSIDFFSSDASTDGPGVGARLSAVTEGAAGRSFGLMFSTRSGDLGTALSEKMRITSTGNVGIGTSTPGLAKLIVEGTSVSSLSALGISNTANTANSRTLINFYDVTAENSAAIGTAREASATDWGLIFRTGSGNSSSGPSDRMYISAAGNVGIGTTSPWTRLAVTGSTTIAGGPLIVLGSANTPISADTDWYRQFALFKKDINDYAFTTFENRNGGSNASVDLLWNNNRTTALSYYANLGFNSSAFNNPVFGNLNVANAWYGYNTDGPILWATATTSTAGYFDVTTGGYTSSRFRITSTGNVGIGTTTPNAALNVNTTLTNGTPAFRISNTGAGPTWNGLVIDSNNASSINARNWFIGANSVVYGDFNIRTSNAYGGNPTTSGTSRFYISETGSVGIGTTTPQSTLSVGSVNDATNSYAQIDSVNGVPTAGDCDTDLERGRMIIDYSNNRFYICNGATRGWDYSALTD